LACTAPNVTLVGTGRRPLWCLVACPALTGRSCYDRRRSSAQPDGKTITEHELEQCQRANQTGRRPVVFVHGDFMLLNPLSETRATRAAIDQANAFLRAGLGTG
jgi:hypothetical protein